MFDDIAGRYDGVDEREDDRLYIVMAMHDIIEASRLLSAHRIPHSVEGGVPNFDGVSRWPMPVPRFISR